MCEFALAALKAAQEGAIAASQGDKTATTVVECGNPEGCRMSFMAKAKNGKLTGGGINEGYPCTETGGRPN